MEDTEKYITHCTRNIKSLMSILELGFVYIPNETKIWRKLFDSLDTDLPDMNTGMISFTEMSLNQDLSMCSVLNNFGPFGIVVDYNWCLDNDIKPVIYIDENSEVFNSFKKILMSCIPKQQFQTFLGGRWTDLEDCRTEKILKDIILSNPHLPSHFTNPMYFHMLELLKWVETSDHSYENELRIRSKNSFFISQQGTVKLDKIETVLQLSDLCITNFLKISPEFVINLICPSDYMQELEHNLECTEYSKIKILSY